MISEKQLPELGSYKRLETRIPVEMRPDLCEAVVPGQNDEVPVHRWFKFKESFSADLLSKLLSITERTDDQNLQMLDPFCGAGTVLVSAQELSRSTTISATGIERNPFIHFVARTKTLWPNMNPEAITELGTELIHKSKHKSCKLPPLSSITSGRCISRHNAQRLISIRDAISHDGSSPNHQALLLGLASSVELLSKTRKDGRALRLVHRERKNIESVLVAKWQQIAADIRFMQQLLPRAQIPRVHLGDGRSPGASGVLPGTIDLLVTSPPYPNNIDYSEVYKLELWLLGFIADAAAFLRLRKSTFRSHPSAAPPDTEHEIWQEVKKGMLKSTLGPAIRRTATSPDAFRQRLPA